MINKVDRNYVPSRRTKSLDFDLINQKKNLIPRSNSKIVYARVQQKSSESIDNQQNKSEKKTRDLFEAVKCGNEEALFTAYKHGLLRMRNEDGNNVGHIAALYNHLNIIQRISELEPLLFRERNKRGLTTAAMSCKSGHLQILQWMVTNLEDVSDELRPSAEEATDLNLLYVSIIYNQPDCCLWICSEIKRRGHNLNQQDSKRFSAAHIAAKFGNLHCLQILISSGASIHLLDYRARDAAQLAYDSGQNLVVGYLALAEKCFQLTSQLKAIQNVSKSDQSTQTCQTSCNNCPKSKTSLKSELQESPYSPTEFLNSDVPQPNTSKDYCRTYIEQSKCGGSLFPASIAGSVYTERADNTCPTVSNCTNETQMETKAEMRQRMSKVAEAITETRVVSPKRCLGSGPVLVGKLETVSENGMEPLVQSRISTSDTISIKSKEKLENHRRTISDVMETSEASNNSKFSNGVDYLPTSSSTKESVSDLTSSFNRTNSPAYEISRSVSPRSLRKEKLNKKIVKSDILSFSKSMRKEWKKLFRK